MAGLCHESNINVAKRERRRYVPVKGVASLTDCSIEALRLFSECDSGEEGSLEVLEVGDIH
jgi:type II secretory pathway predicted ATPase ExeA